MCKGRLPAHPEFAEQLLPPVCWHGVKLLLVSRQLQHDGLPKQSCRSSTSGNDLTWQTELFRGWTVTYQPLSSCNFLRNAVLMLSTG